MRKKIQLMVADDHVVYRDGLRLIFAAHPELEVIGEASNGYELLELCSRRVPDVILSDINMPQMNGIEATSFIRENYPAVRIIALSMSQHDPLVLDMLEAGASGYLVKNTEKFAMMAAIHAVLNDQLYIGQCSSPKLTQAIRIWKSSKRRKRIYFSRKELQIIRLICEEKISKEIAFHMNLSVRTVEEYRTRIKQKMEVRGSVGIALYAIQNDMYHFPTN